MTVTRLLLPERFYSRTKYKKRSIVFRYGLASQPRRVFLGRKRQRAVLLQQPFLIRYSPPILALLAGRYLDFMGSFLPYAAAGISRPTQRTSSHV